MSTKDVRLGARGEEILGLCYRLGGMTVRQYYVLSQGRDEDAQEDGRKSNGREAQRLLETSEETIRQWIREGESDEDMASWLHLGVGSVRRFVARRGLRKGAA